MLGRFENGDTLIEVLFAVAIFSLVAVGSLSIMNQGLYTAQRSLEITQVRQQIDGQAETLRFLNASYVAAYDQELTSGSYDGPAAVWLNLVNYYAQAIPATDFGGISSCPKNISEFSRSRNFILNTIKGAPVELTNSNYKPATTHSMITYDSSDNLQASYGIWVEAVKGNASGVSDYVDFHVRACWETFGMSAPETIGTIVRLYEPKD